MRYIVIKTVFTFLLLAFLKVSSFSQNLDYQFAPFIKGGPSVSKIIPQEDGKIILSGNITSVKDKKVSSLIRLNQDGSLDNSFNSNLDDGYISNMQYDNGKLLMFKHSYGSTSYSPYLTRLNNDGSVDDSFKVDEELGIRYRYKVQNNKYIAFSVTWPFKQELIRLNHNGSVDASFQALTIEGELHRLEVLPDNKILVFILKDSKLSMLRLHENGGIDSSFDIGDGIQQVHPYINSVAIQPDGKIIIQGDFAIFNHTETGGIVRLNIDGSVDESFVMPGPTSNAFNHIHDMRVLPSGKILVIGSTYDHSQNKSQYLLMRLHHDGSLDPSFTTKTLNNLYSTIYNNCSIALSDETVYLAGSFSTYNSVERLAIAAINMDGTLQDTFNPNLGGEVELSRVIQQPNGKILLAGRFIEINGSRVTNLARLNSNGSLDTTFSYSGMQDLKDNSIYALALQSDGKILIGGYLSKKSDQNQKGILRLNSDGTFDESFRQNISYNDEIQSVSQIHVLEDGSILVNGRYYKNFVTKLDADGYQIKAFNLSIPIDFEIPRILLDKDKILMAGQISYNEKVEDGYTTISKGYLARYNLNGDQDSSFREVNFTQHYINTIAKVGNRILAGGSIWVGHGNGDSNTLFQINEQGEIVDPYSLSTNGFGSIHAVLPITDSTLIIGGSFEKMNNLSRNNLAKVDTKGRIHRDFRYDIDKAIYGIIQENKDQILVYGNFKRVNGISGLSSIARLNINTPRSPLDLSATLFANRGVVLNWVDSSEVETGYKIYRSSASSSGYEIIDSVTANVTTYLDASISPSNTYHYKVITARDTLISDFTNQVSITTADLPKPKTPQGLTLEDENASVYLLWNQSVDVSGYIVERSVGNEFVVVDTVATNSYTDIHIKPEVTYYYRIKAYTLLGESDYSDVVDYTNSITAIDSSLPVVDIVAYPNPSAGSFTIPLQENFNIDRIKVLNIESKQMATATCNYQDQSLTIDLSNFKSGVYLIQINIKGKNQVFRLIKQ